MKRIISLLIALLLISSLTYAQELTQREDYSDTYYAIYHYATAQDKEEGLPSRVDYYYDNALSSSVIYQTLSDGTLRIDVLNEVGQLEGYSLSLVSDAKEVTEEYDANDKLTYRFEQFGDQVITTSYVYLEDGSLDYKEVMTSSFSTDVSRTDIYDAKDNLLYYIIGTSDREDRFSPDGRLEQFTRYQVDEDGTYRESTFNAKGEMQFFIVHTYEEDGAIRVENYSGQGQLESYTLTRFDDVYAITETFDAQGNLLSTEKEDAMMH